MSFEFLRVAVTKLSWRHSCDQLKAWQIAIHKTSTFGYYFEVYTQFGFKLSNVSVFPSLPHELIVRPFTQYCSALNLKIDSSTM